MTNYISEFMVLSMMPSQQVIKTHVSIVKFIEKPDSLLQPPFVLQQRWIQASQNVALITACTIVSKMKRNRSPQVEKSRGFPFVIDALIKSQNSVT